MIKIYIYKILYNKFGINAFINQEIVDKYNLKDYKDFSKLIQINEFNSINKKVYKIRTLKVEFYEHSNIIIKNYQKNESSTQKKDRFLYCRIWH